jgi:hypothetical protein
MAKFLYLSDGNVPFQLERDDVDLAKLLLQDGEARVAVIQQFRGSGPQMTLGHAIAVVFCAENELKEQNS